MKNFFKRSSSQDTPSWRPAIRHPFHDGRRPHQTDLRPDPTGSFVHFRGAPPRPIPHHQPTDPIALRPRLDRDAVLRRAQTSVGHDQITAPLSHQPCHSSQERYAHLRHQREMSEGSAYNPTGSDHDQHPPSGEQQIGPQHGAWPRGHRRGHHRGRSIEREKEAELTETRPLPRLTHPSQIYHHYGSLRHTISLLRQHTHTFRTRLYNLDCSASPETSYPSELQILGSELDKEVKDLGDTLREIRREEKWLARGLTVLKLEGKLRDAKMHSEMLSLGFQVGRERKVAEVKVGVCESIWGRVKHGGVVGEKEKEEEEEEEEEVVEEEERLDMHRGFWMEGMRTRREDVGKDSGEETEGVREGAEGYDGYAGNDAGTLRTRAEDGGWEDCLPEDLYYYGH